MKEKLQYSIHKPIIFKVIKLLNVLDSQARCRGAVSSGSACCSGFTEQCNRVGSTRTRKPYTA